ncbi:hypothetical protein HDV01_001782 [Terramyces sp. JEL0728]|nr:hypothetical protein HDV01_001782 [Terramyces sp. JEL0728]
MDTFNNDLPILQGCVSVLICKPFKKDIVGDHDVWYGEIVDIRADGIKIIQGEKEPLKPLLYFDSNYRSVGDEVFIEAFENSKLEFQDWTHRAHVRMAWIYIRDDSYSQEESFAMIKKGIVQYNLSNQERISHGYNHTITTFFSKLVALALENDVKNGSGNDDFLDFLERYPKLDTFSTIFNYYAKEILYSDKAKTSSFETCMGLTGERIKQLRDNFGQSKPTLIRSYSRNKKPKVEPINRDNCSLCLERFETEFNGNSNRKCYQLKCCGNFLHRECYSQYRLNKFEQCLLCRAMLPDVSTEQIYKSFNKEDESLVVANIENSIVFHLETEGELYDNQMELLLKISSDTKRDSASGLDLVFVVDVSGSMQAVKLDLVKQSIIYLIEHQLQERDRLAIITFNQHAKVVCNFTCVNNENKAELSALVNGALHAEGGTSIIEGIKMALDMLDCRSIINHSSCILLFSDGSDTRQADKHCTFDYVEKAKQKGLAIQCFGYGQDHDYKYLNGIALSSANGSYVYIESPNEISAGLVGAVAGISPVCPQDLKIMIDCRPSKMTELHCAAYPSTIEDGVGTIHLTNLFEGETRNITCRLELCPNWHLSCVGYLISNLPYINQTPILAKLAKPSIELQKQKAEDLLRQSLSTCIALAEDGDFLLAQTHFQQQRDALVRRLKELQSKHPQLDFAMLNDLLFDIDQVASILDPQIFENGGKMGAIAKLSHLKTELSQQRTLRLQSEYRSLRRYVSEGTRTGIYRHLTLK